MYVTISTDHGTASQTEGMQGAQARFSENVQAPTVRVRAGSYLYYEGDPVERLYEVASGVVRLTRLLEDGRRQVIAFGYPGDIIGFPAGDCHHTDCDAISDATLHSYRRSALDTGDGDPALHAKLLQAALREISAMQDHFMMLGRKSAAERVASFLSVLLDRNGGPAGAYRQITLPMSRADIADFLGLTIETVSRCFTALRKSGVIALQGSHTVILLDDAALRAQSHGQPKPAAGSRAA
ncbi:MAG: helix-turn-helix domain-containing protein [Pseudomonadota bacterium]